MNNVLKLQEHRAQTLVTDVLITARLQKEEEELNLVHQKIMITE